MGNYKLKDQMRALFVIAGMKAFATAVEIEAEAEVEKDSLHFIDYGHHSPSYAHDLSYIKPIKKVVYSKPHHDYTSSASSYYSDIVSEIYSDDHHGPVIKHTKYYGYTKDPYYAKPGYGKYKNKYYEPALLDYISFLEDKVDDLKGVIDYLKANTYQPPAYDPYHPPSYDIKPHHVEYEPRHAGSSYVEYTTPKYHKPDYYVPPSNKRHL